MLCPKCEWSTRVLESRLASGNRFRRRRECLGCGCRFTTYEEIAGAQGCVTVEPMDKAALRAKLIAAVDKVLEEDG